MADERWGKGVRGTGATADGEDGPFVRTNSCSRSVHRQTAEVAPTCRQAAADGGTARALAVERPRASRIPA